MLFLLGVLDLAIMFVREHNLVSFPVQLLFLVLQFKLCHLCGLVVVSLLLFQDLGFEFPLVLQLSLLELMDLVRLPCEELLMLDSFQRIRIFEF